MRRVPYAMSQTVTKSITNVSSRRVSTVSQAIQQGEFPTAHIISQNEHWQGNKSNCKTMLMYFICKTKIDLDKTFSHNS